MKINKKKSVIESFLVIGMLIVLVCPLISAIGVGGSYSGSSTPLELSPGQEKAVIIYLQNFDIEEEISLRGEILVGSEIASLKETKVTLPYQTKKTIDMVVKVPAEASIGDKYNIQYEFKQVDTEGEGMVTFAQSIISNFDVNVVEDGIGDEPEGMNMTIIYWIIGIVIVIVIAWFFIKKKKASIPVK